MATATKVKEFTKEEIANLSDVQLENFAGNLPWPFAGTYSYRTNMKKYKSRGYPRELGGTKVTSRRHFLILRLQRSKQEKWNPAIKEIVAARKKEEAKKEAKKAKVKVSTQVSVMVHLTDVRPGGRTFRIWVMDNKVYCQQDQDAKGSVGRKACNAKSVFPLTTFQDAIDIAERTAVPKSTKGVEITSEIRLISENSTDLLLERDGQNILIWQYDRYESHRSKADKWHFRISDLKEVVAALGRKYQFKVVDETPNGAAKEG